MYPHFPYIMRCEEYVVYSITFPSNYKPALMGLCFTLSYQHRTFEFPPTHLSTSPQSLKDCLYEFSPFPSQVTCLSSLDQMIMTSVSHLITSHARLIFVTDCRKLTLSIALEWTATAYCSYKVYVKARQVVAKLYWAGALACTHTHTHVLIAGWFNSLPYCSLLGNDVVCKLKQKLIHLLLSNQNINNTKHYGNKTNKCT